MKSQKLLFIILLLPLCLSAKREYQSPHPLKYNTLTTYENRTFKTTSSFTVKAPYSTANKVMEKFILDLDRDPYSLFNNMLKGMGDEPASSTASNSKQSSGKFSIEIKSCVFDTAHNYYIGKLDFHIGKAVIEDITLYGRITKHYHKDYAVFTFELLNNPVAKKAQGIIVVKHLGENLTKAELTAEFQFSWFLNIFFSTKNYKDVAEWRLDKFMQNFNEEILKRK
jgi:hypothetical protein